MYHRLLSYILYKNLFSNDLICIIVGMYKHVRQSLLRGKTKPSYMYIFFIIIKLIVTWKSYINTLTKQTC